MKVIKRRSTKLHRSQFFSTSDRQPDAEPMKRPGCYIARPIRMESFTEQSVSSCDAIENVGSVEPVTLTVLTLMNSANGSNGARDSLSVEECDAQGTLSPLL